MAELTIFAQRLKMAREIRKMKQNELARKVNVTPQTISAYEKAESDGKGKNPTLENAVAIAKTLGFSLDWMCGLSLDPNPENNMTYGDIARIIEEISTWDRDLAVICNKCITLEGDENSEGPAVIFTGGTLKDFVSDLLKMKSLLQSGTFSIDFYNRWIEDRIKSLDELKVEDDMGQLPF